MTVFILQVFKTWFIKVGTVCYSYSGIVVPVSTDRYPYSSLCVSLLKIRYFKYAQTKFVRLTVYLPTIWGTIPECSLRDWGKPRSRQDSACPWHLPNMTKWHYIRQIQSPLKIRCIPLQNCTLAPVSLLSAQSDDKFACRSREVVWWSIVIGEVNIFLGFRKFQYGTRNQNSSSSVSLTISVTYYVTRFKLRPSKRFKM
jgi:hypothetical protein